MRGEDKGPDAKWVNCRNKIKAGKRSSILGFESGITKLQIRSEEEGPRKNLVAKT